MKVFIADDSVVIRSKLKEAFEESGEIEVVGEAGDAEQAIANLKRLFDDDLKVEYELIVVDVLDSPQLAEEDRILATPTLIKVLPPPLRRLTLSPSTVKSYVSNILSKFGVASRTKAVALAL